MRWRRDGGGLVEIRDVASVVLARDGGARGVVMIVMRMIKVMEW